MLTEVDKENLKYPILIKFCEEHNITDIDAHYYLKLGYEHIKDELEEGYIYDFLDYIYDGLEEHFEVKYIKNR